MANKIFLVIVTVVTLIQNTSAQCTILANAVPGITYTYSQSGGTNATGIAYNPNFNIYYAVIGGNSGFPLETFNPSGVSLYQTNTGFDFRGFWWNPNANQLEANGYFTFGIWTTNLNVNGYALNTGSTIFSGMLQPTDQSCGDYDCEANEIIYYNNGSIYRYARTTGSFLGSYLLTGMPVPIGNINITSVIYTGCAGNEIGIEDYINKSILLFNKATGAYSGTCMLPASAVTNYNFRFSYANNLAWLYDVNTRTWTSYSIFSGIPSGAVTVNLGNDTLLCAGQTLLLDAGNPGAIYLWQDGSTDQKITVTAEGSYSVAVYNGGCYSSRDTIQVNYSGGVSHFLGNDTSVCTGTSVVLDAGSAGSSWIWQDGSANSSYTVTTPGLYWAEVSSGNCAPVRDSMMISFNYPPSVNLGNDTTICGNVNMGLNAMNAGAWYQWSTGAVTASIIASSPGTYSVLTTNNCGNASDTIIIIGGNSTNAGTISALRDTICSHTPAILSVTDNSDIVQWQSSVTQNNFTNIPGATNTSLIDIPAQTIYYRTFVSEGSCSDTSAPFKIVIKLSPQAVFNSVNAGLQVTFNSGGSSGDISSYNWDFGDNITSTLPNPVHSFMQADTFHVCLTVFNGSNCSFTICRDVFVGLSSAIKISDPEDNWSIYPNPANDKLFVEGVKSTSEIEILDLLGRTLYDSRELNTPIILNLTDFPAGIYYIQVKSHEGKSGIKKFVKG